MQRLIQSIQVVCAEAGTLAWVALGILLPFFIMGSLVAFTWIRRGGLCARSTSEFLSEQAQIAVILATEGDEKYASLAPGS
jgi:hypothetical protein